MDPFTIAAVAAAVISLFTGAKAAEAEAEAAVQKNQAIRKYNDQVMRKAADETSQVNMQRAQALRETTSALFNINMQEVAAKDEASSYAAANDNIGASTQAAAQAVAVQADRASADALLQNDYQNEGFNMMLRNISEGAQSSLQDAYKSQYSSMMKQAVVGAAATGLTTYASLGGTFGAGKAATDTVTGSLAKATVDTGFVAPKAVTGLTQTVGTGTSNFWGSFRLQ